MISRRVIICVLALSAATAGCGGDGAGEDGIPTTSSTPATGDGRGALKLVEVGQFDQPLYLTQPAGSDLLYVVEKGGRVRVVRDGQVLSEPFLDLSDSVSSTGEQGLLSIAFAPDFERSRLFYAYYTDRQGDQRISEFEAPSDQQADRGSEREVLVMDDFASNHNGGLLLFGPDERLYVGTGDGGLPSDQRNGQELGSLLGKILRFDPRESGQRAYTVPSDNPFTSRSGARPEVYVYGLRNPWRFSFDRGDLLVADVGQSGFEEIDYLPAARIAGANLGWSAFEGNARFDQDQQAARHVAPILTYPTGDRCSITGGYVVRDRSLPALYGRYLYGDFCTGELRSLIATPRGARDDASLGLSVPALSSFGQDADGRIYATSLEGPVFRLDG